MPKTHIVIAGSKKVIPLDDGPRAFLAAALSTFGTGQRITVYTDRHRPRQENELTGLEDRRNLLDNGRNQYPRPMKKDPRKPLLHPLRRLVRNASAQFKEHQAGTYATAHSGPIARVITCISDLGETEAPQLCSPSLAATSRIVCSRNQSRMSYCSEPARSGGRRDSPFAGENDLEGLGNMAMLPPLDRPVNGSADPKSSFINRVAETSGLTHCGESLRLFPCNQPAGRRKP